MASYRLLAADVTNVRKAASMYAEGAVNYRQWCPIETIPEAYVSKWYTLNRFVQPMLSREGHVGVGVSTSRTEDSANMVYMRYDFDIPYTELVAARNAGVPLQDDYVRIGLKQMHLKIAQMIYTGLDYPIQINGMTEDGTDVGAGLDSVKWATAGEAIDHADVAYSHMRTYGFDPPYAMIVSTGLTGDLAAKHNAMSDLSTRAYIENAFQCTIYDELSAVTGTFDATPDATTIYPMEHTGDDGIWVFCKPDIENFALQEVAPPQVYLNPERDLESNSFKGFIYWHGTWRTTHNTSICFMEDVDLVT